MKTIIALLLLVPALLFARENKVGHFSKLIKLDINGSETKFVISHSDEDNAYYRADDYDNEDLRLHISVSYNQKTYVELLSYNESIKIESVTELKPMTAYTASSQRIAKRTYNYSKNDFEYFSSTVLEGAITKTTLKFHNLEAKNYFDRIDAQGKYISALEYSPCDGCEHGDQFFISTPYGQINVVYQNFADFYTPTCDEELHPWLAQLIELEVPFMFYGTIDASSSDYWEGHEDHWMAATGTLSLGSKKENQFSRIMQLVIFKAAEASGENAMVSYDSIIKEGKFVSFGQNVLVFEYKSHFIEINL